MGTLQYDGVLIEFDDRVLAHIQIVITQKIRRGESFLMSWRDSVDYGNGHSAVWIHPAQNLFFKFSGGRNPAINDLWVAELFESANSSRGMLVSKEPDGSGNGARLAEGHAVTRPVMRPHVKPQQ